MVYKGLGGQILNISTNEAIFPHYSTLWLHDLKKPMGFGKQPRHAENAGNKFRLIFPSSELFWE